jgi:hypothetical protein
MMSFKEFLAEGNKKYYPYKLARRKKGQKKRTIAMSNAYFVSHKALSKKIAAAKRTSQPTKNRYKKKTYKR